MRFHSLRVRRQRATVATASPSPNNSPPTILAPFFTFDPAGFSLEEQNDSELDDAVVDATPDDGDDIDDVVIDLSSSSSTEPKSTTAKAEAAAAATATATVPPPRSGVLKRASSVATGLKTSNASAPALAMTTSPALVGHNSRRSDRDTVVVTHAEIEVSAASALAQAASVEELAGARWGDDSPPARLSRSLSASQSSAPTAWSGAAAAGCAKVTRSSHRRRSRANSTSSPLPLLEMSVSMPTLGAVGGLEDTAAGADWTTRSFGSGSAGFPRHGRRGSYAGTSSIENLRKKGLLEGPAAVHGSAPLARSHRMPVWNEGNVLKSVGRPISLPSGITQRAIRGAEGVADGDASSIGGDAGFGWVLRSPGAPLDHRRRSQSFAGGRTSLARSRSDSNPSAFSSMNGTRERPPGLPGASDDEYGLPGTWTGRGSEGHGQGPMVDGAEDNDMSPAQTPQASPSQHGTSAAMQRAHGLSSMARRMDRLEIRSPNVETHAAEVHRILLALFWLFHSVVFVT